jgi:hypothetical protein
MNLLVGQLPFQHKFVDERFALYHLVVKAARAIFQRA